MSAPVREFDVVFFGSAQVVFCAKQLGSPLSDAVNFQRYLGGAAAVQAIGAARLGLRAAIVTCLGEDANGRFIHNSLVSEGVDCQAVQWDQVSLTRGSLMGVKDEGAPTSQQMVDRPADLAFILDGSLEKLFSESNTLVISMSFLADSEKMMELGRQVIKLAQDQRNKVVLIIDVPVHSIHPHSLQPLLELAADAQLVVVKETALGQVAETTALEQSIGFLRSITASDLLVWTEKGCYALLDQGHEALDTLSLERLLYSGFEAPVLNQAGAFDAFAVGFLRGWCHGKTTEVCATEANYCAALAASRHGVSCALPGLREIEYLVQVQASSLQQEADKLSYLHRFATSRKEWSELCVLAFDHRKQFVDMARAQGADLGLIPKAKNLIYQAALETAAEVGLGNKAGILVDDEFGQSVLNAVTGSGVWIGRPVEQPASRPLEFQAGEVSDISLESWPTEHVIKCLVFYHPDDPMPLRLTQERQVKALYRAAQHSGHELLLEVIAPQGSVIEDDTYARAMTRFYNLGVFPHWWKLPGQSAKSWALIDQLIANFSPECRGVVLLGLDAPIEQLIEQFQTAQSSCWLRGFMVGRTIFGEPTRAWFAGQLDDADYLQAVKENYKKILQAWNSAKNLGSSRH